MKKYLKNKLVLFAVVIVIVLAIFLGFESLRQQPQTKSNSQVYNTNSVSQKSLESISYKGKANINALALLRQNNAVSLDQSGMVSSINGRKVDSAKHEYWAFYINGKLGNVGSADYLTKDSDLIEWKVEKY